MLNKQSILGCLFAILIIASYFYGRMEASKLCEAKWIQKEKISREIADKKDLEVARIIEENAKIINQYKNKKYNGCSEIFKDSNKILGLDKNAEI